jgi:mannose-1-phosphate guanylyltransferase/mannose-1-phosphate guanylyltransferase/mannose-6-phosphate isomerase
MFQLSHFKKDIRPWGNFEQFTLNEQTTVKLITVSPGEVLSLQTHSKRQEFWRVISGHGIASVDGVDQELSTGVDVYIPLGAKHRVQATTETLLFMEIAFGEFDENDIVRLEDKYGRK